MKKEVKDWLIRHLPPMEIIDFVEAYNRFDQTGNYITLKHACEKIALMHNELVFSVYQHIDEETSVLECYMTMQEPRTGDLVNFQIRNYDYAFVAQKPQ
jgi:hypothetical protein